MESEKSISFFDKAVLRAWVGRAAMVTLVVVPAFIWYVVGTPQDRLVLLPALLMCVVAAGFVALLHAKTEQFPLGDLGVICVAATSCYLILPILAYVLSGHAFSSLSDGRLNYFGTYDTDVASFGWDGFAYLVPLCISYFVVRNWSRSPQRLTGLGAPTVTAILLIVAGCLLFRSGVEHVFGVNLIKSNVEIAAQQTQELPHSVAQVTNIVLNVLTVGEIALVIVLLGFAKRRPGAFVLLLGWIVVNGYLTVRLQGSRTPEAILILATIIGYHRYVRPISGAGAAILVGLLFGSVVAYGRYRAGAAIGGSPFAVSNDFQVLMSTAISVKQMVAAHMISVPWQVRWAAFANILPQQFMPFQKIDPANWYVTLLPWHDTSGYMFGVLSQAAIGYGRTELVVRGFLLGTVLALVNNLLSRRTGVLSATAYIWLCCISYETYRSMTLAPLDMALQFLLPFILLAIVLSGILSGMVEAPVGGVPSAKA